MHLLITWESVCIPKQVFYVPPSMCDDLIAKLTATSPSTNEPIYDQTIQSIKRHHLERAHMHNIVMISLKFEFDSQAVFAQQMGTLSLITSNYCASMCLRVCVCVCVCGRQPH